MRFAEENCEVSLAAARLGFPVNMIIAGQAGRVHVGMDNEHFALQVQTAIGSEIYILTIILVVSVLVAYGLMYQVVATNDMGESTLATPAFSEGVMFWRTQGHLIAVGP